MTEIHPRLVIRDADAALSFYTAAFAAGVTERYTDAAGRVVHAMVDLGGARFALKEADEHDPAPGDDAPAVIVALYVDDPDAVAARMVDGGGRVVFPVADQPYGERGGRLADPFGHVWMVARRSGDLGPEEVQARTAAMG